MNRLLLAACCLLVAVPATAQVVRVSVSTAGVQGDGPSTQPSISDNGRYVAFASRATTLVTGDTNNTFDVFLRDRDIEADGVLDEAGAVATTRLSVGDTGVQSNGWSDQPKITPDGRYVVFASTATNLLPGTSGAAPPATDAGPQITGSTAPTARWYESVRRRTASPPTVPLGGRR